MSIDILSYNAPTALSRTYVSKFDFLSHHPPCPPFTRKAGKRGGFFIEFFARGKAARKKLIFYLFPGVLRTPGEEQFCQDA